MLHLTKMPVALASMYFNFFLFSPTRISGRGVCEGGARLRWAEHSVWSQEGGSRTVTEERGAWLLPVSWDSCRELEVSSI